MAKFRLRFHDGWYSIEKKGLFGNWEHEDLVAQTRDQAIVKFHEFMANRRRHKIEEVIFEDDDTLPIPESKVKAKIKKVLEDLGVYYFMPATGGYGDSGVSDFVCCVNGKMVGIECKAGKNTPTALQLKHKRDIEASGGVWLLANEFNLQELTLKLIYLKENK